MKIVKTLYKWLVWHLKYSLGMVDLSIEPDIAQATISVVLSGIDTILTTDKTCVNVSRDLVGTSTATNMEEVFWGGGGE